MNKVDIVEVLSRHVELKKHEGKFVGICPICRFGTMTVYPDEQIATCAACNFKGDIYQLALQIGKYDDKGKIGV